MIQKIYAAIRKQLLSCLFRGYNITKYPAALKCSR